MSHRTITQSQNPAESYPDDNPKTLLGIKKVSLSKVPPAALVYGALAMMDGAVKYGPYNWRSKRVTASIYVDALLRHVLAWWDGEELAPDSKRPHLGHAMACLFIIIDALETDKLNDDRPPPGAMARLIEKYTISGFNEAPLIVLPTGNASEAKFLAHIKANGGLKLPPRKRGRPSKADVAMREKIASAQAALLKPPRKTAAKRRGR